MREIDFDAELRICMEHRRQGYCYWGICKHCGVPQLLEKLKTGKIEHNEEKHEIFKKMAEMLK